MRIGRLLKDGVLTFAEPRQVRTQALSADAVSYAFRSVGTGYTMELQLKQTLGLFDEDSVSGILGAVAMTGDWTGADPTS